MLFKVLPQFSHKSFKILLFIIIPINCKITSDKDNVIEIDGINTFDNSPVLDFKS